MIDSFAPDGNSATIKSSLGGGVIDFYNVRSKEDIVKLYFMSFHYDVIYDVLCCVSKYFSILNKYHLLHPKLVSIYHHPSFAKVMRYGRSDVSVFFTDRLKSEAQKDVNDNRKMLSNYWYPDKKWYDVNSKPLVKCYDFMDNGKTGRDHESFIQALKAIDASGIMICSESQKEEYRRTNCKLDFFCQKSPNDLNVLPYINKTKVLVIPLTNKSEVLGPIGNTSYMDAIACGMPIICTSNAAFAKEVIDNNLGETYECGDTQSLANAMKLTLEKYDLYHNNMIKFSQGHTIEQYSSQIMPFLLNNN